jgi:hypothetical protein
MYLLAQTVLVWLLAWLLLASSVPKLTSLDWRVDYVMASSYLRNADTNNIRMQLHVQQPGAAAVPTTGVDGEPAVVAEELLSFSLTPAEFNLLYAELQHAKKLLANVRT